MASPPDSVTKRPTSVLTVSLMILTLVLISCQVNAMSPRKSNQTGRVRVLFIGAPLDTFSLYVYLRIDPFFEVTPIQAHIFVYEWDDLRRWIRLYMPRDFQELVEKYDLISLVGANPQVFSGKVRRWLSDSVIQAGLGQLLAGYGTWHFADWIDLVQAGEAFPIEIVDYDATWKTSTLRILKPEHPLFESLPWSSMGKHGIFPGFTPVRAREGAEVVAELVPMSGRSNPFIVWWDVGKGRSVVGTAIPCRRPIGCPFFEWEFLPDSWSNLHLYSAGVQIPPDVILVHQMRLTLEEYHLRRDSLISLIEFISKFGANPRRVEVILSTTDEQLEEAERMCIAQDFEDGLALATNLVGDIIGGMEIAVELKNQVLLWVYVIEWLVLTGTSLVAGFVLWTCMVRRRYYREIRTTRLEKLEN